MAFNEVMVIGNLGAEAVVRARRPVKTRGESHRLQANVIEIRSRRERSEGIPLLMSHFIKIFNASAEPVVPVTGIAKTPWPHYLCIRGRAMRANFPTARVRSLSAATRYCRRQFSARRSSQNPHAPNRSLSCLAAPFGNENFAGADVDIALRKGDLDSGLLQGSKQCEIKVTPYPLRLHLFHVNPQQQLEVQA